SRLPMTRSSPIEAGDMGSLGCPLVSAAINLVIGLGIQARLFDIVASAGQDECRVAFERSAKLIAKAIDHVMLGDAKIGLHVFAISLDQRIEDAPHCFEVIGKRVSVGFVRLAINLMRDDGVGLDGHVAPCLYKV